MVDFDTVRSSLSDGGDTTVPDCSDHSDGLMLMEGRMDAAGTSSCDLLRKEEARLLTFRHWPKEWGVELARFGFSSTNDYLGTVRCVFCGREVAGFSTPQEAHLNHWQLARHYCPYLRGEDVGNVPLNGHQLASQETVPAQTRTCFERTHLLGTSAIFPTERQPHSNGPEERNTHGPSQRFSSAQREPETVAEPRHTAAARRSAKSPVRASASWSKLGQEREARPQPVSARGGVHWTEMVRTARYPGLASYQQRLRTLRRWPLLKPSPAELARAGFFQVPGASGCAGLPQGGEEGGDAVKCFWCGERIHRWQRTDDALLEHARLSPGCLYVIQLLGQPLLDDIVHAADVAIGSQRNDVTASPVTWNDDEIVAHREQLDRTQTAADFLLSAERHGGGTARHHHPPTGRLTSAQLDDLMQSPSVQTVLQMGFPRQLIRDLLSHNSHRLTAETLCRLALQAAEERTSSGVSPPPRPPHPPSLQALASEGLIPYEDGSTTLRLTRSGKVPEPSQRHETRQTLGCGVDDDTRREEGAGSSPARGRGGSGERLLCKVCSEAEVKVMFRPCNHLVCCWKCRLWFSTCPVCHQSIEEVLAVRLAT